MSTTPSITCPDCGRKSYNPNDIRERYCGYCHWWTSDPLLGRVHPGAPVRVQVPVRRLLRDALKRQYTEYAFGVAPRNFPP